MKTGNRISKRLDFLPTASSPNIVPAKTCFMGIRPILPCLVLLASLCACGLPSAGALADTPTFTIVFHDGQLAPVHIEVPANQHVRIGLNNTGKTPAEFESHELHIEKVVPPNSKSMVVLRPLDPGKYVYFDDFHEDAPKGVLIAK